MTSITALLSRGAGGLEPATPLEFASLVLPRSPNTCLAAPAWHPGFKHLETPLYPVSPARLFAALRQVVAPMPRTTLMAAWEERFQAQWVERSAVANFPDIIVAQAVAGPEGGAGLFLYSHSLFGYSDLGVNRSRVDRWLAAIAPAV
jgi:uncharacterized protein (DUF1499 family)